MTFDVTKASDSDYKETIEIRTLEELMKLVDKVGAIIIGEREHITIYDDYLE